MLAEEKPVVSAYSREFSFENPGNFDAVDYRDGDEKPI